MSNVRISFNVALEDLGRAKAVLEAGDFEIVGVHTANGKALADPIVATTEQVSEILERFKRRPGRFRVFSRSPQWGGKVIAGVLGADPERDRDRIHALLQKLEKDGHLAFRREKNALCIFVRGEDR